MNTEMNFRFCFVDPVITKAMIPNSLSQWSKVSAVCSFYREIRKANTTDPGEQERQKSCQRLHRVAPREVIYKPMPR